MAPCPIRANIRHMSSFEFESTTDDPHAASGVRPYALDPKRADALWALSERLVG